jgi:membrane fusion protein, multidrug efflux system
MKRLITLSAVLLIVMGFSLDATAADAVSALVQTQPLVRHELSETVSCYGSVVVDPLSTESINVPRAGRVTRLLVSQGEAVKEGAPLLQFETSPQESVNYDKASSSVELAKGELARVQNLLEQQLATRSQLATAEKALRDAKAEFSAQQKMGTGLQSQVITAPFDGIVSALLVSQGERIQADATALRLSRQDRLRVVLGIEPEDARKVKRGMAVELVPVFFRSQSASGVVRIVSGMINPQSGLIELLVKVKPGQAVRLMPGIRMEGRITLMNHQALAVPRQAILSDDQGSYIFVVRNKLAHRINVKTGIEAHGFVGIDGSFENSDRVVVVGNYELQEGMAVREASK